ncbi:hypothetical protein ACFYVR_00495 [Rhodococcus sp. NPDC003318]|uniref:hypothetical protein n=1 Tax=Rhodococcus sp. NPDC003318 TaxID=3364503 RepID=UPI0036BAF588
MTEPQSRPPADNIEEEEQAASGAESLDEDRLGMDPLDEGYDAPDGWSEADRFGTTEAEGRRGESLDERLRQEEPEDA